MIKFILAIVDFLSSIGILVIIFVFIKNRWKEANTDLDNGKLKQISVIPLFCKSWVDKGTYYFDDDHLYFWGSQEEKKYLLKDIIEIKKTIRINSIPIMRLTINNNGEKFVLKFWPNVSIFNKNYIGFIDKIKSINPSAVKFKYYGVLFN